MSLPASTPQPYSLDDVRNLNRPALVNIVVGQPGCWPKDLGTFSKSKTTKHAMMTALTRPGSLFRKNVDIRSEAAAHRDERESQHSPSPVHVVPIHYPAGKRIEILLDNLTTQRKFAWSLNDAPIVSDGSCEEGGWCVSGEAVVGWLLSQGHIVAGSVELFHQHHLNPEYQVPILIPPEDHCHVNSLPVTRNGVLYLQACKPASHTDMSTDPTTKYNEPLPSKTTRPPKSSNGLVQWLRQELESRSGYTEYRLTSGKSISNQRVIARWGFIVKFCNDYLGRVDPKGNTKVTKVHLREALQMGETSLLTAEKAYAAVLTITNDGTDTNMMEMLESDAVPGDGSVTLAKCLREWMVNNQ